MKVYRQLEDVPESTRATVVSVGNFDGVHRAHQHVIGEIVRRAGELQATSMVVTFAPHPLRILRPDVAPKLITPLEVKLRLLAKTGVDATLVLPFTRDLSLQTPRQFAENILGRGLRAREVHEGDNFRFGHKAQGHVQNLVELGRELGFAVKTYPEMCMRGETVSSSRIRGLLLEGRVSRARQLLGRPFSIVSSPGRGRGYGSKYTVPTINLSRHDELVPLDGVYVTRTRVGDECFDSVTNCGNRPTFADESFAVESHLLNFHTLELTAQTEVEISFLKRLRGEIRFPSVEALREQIGADVRRAARYFRLAGTPARQR
jgi:riboflavin kinase / FMN adenylyltransferase